MYELHNLLKLLFVIVRERDPGIVQQDDEGEVSGLYVCVLVYICECVRRAQTASELWSLQPMMWKRFIIYLNNTQLFFIDLPSLALVLVCWFDFTVINIEVKIDW